jgi:hypothetical protein
VYFSFGGPGVPGTSGWTTTPESPAVGADGGYYSLYTQCETQGECHDYDDVVLPSTASPGVGGPVPASLRAHREGDDVVLEWTGAAVPPTYGAWRASSRGELAAGVATWPLAGRIAGEGPLGENAFRDAGAALAPGSAFYLVHGRDACTDAPRVP